MDDQNKNLILATVLSFLVIVVWYTVFAPTPPAVDPNAAVPAASQSATDSGTAATTAAGATAAATATEAAPALTTANAPRLVIDTPRLSGSVSLLGGVFDDIGLKDYHETLDTNSPEVKVLTHESSDAIKPYWANFGWRNAAGATGPALPGYDAVWTIEKGDKLTATTPVTLRWDNGAGLTFRRDISVDDNFMFTVTQSVENQTGAAVKLTPYSLVVRDGAPKSVATYVRHEGAIRMADGKLKEVTYKKLPKLDADANGQPSDVADATTGGWVGFTDVYWMTTLVPTPGQPFQASIRYDTASQRFVSEAQMPEMEVAAGATATSSTMLFAGAKEWETIKAYQTNLKIDRFIDSIDWGWFFFLTKPIFWLLHHLHGLIGNMGWSIIALTFIIKALVFPLARKSYISMAKMKELQPEMEKLKEQFGEDRQKMQQGMMALYKREKVNPASGCLPVILQIPIFYSLYKVIYVTIELRHAAWLGWIQDLSAPDPSSIINMFGLLPFDAPGVGSPLHIISLGILPILLGISMWFQQKLNPAPTDPAQATIFAWMPWIFMFMLGTFASGLVLYWITNNTITFLQQYTIMSMHGKRPDIFGNIKSGIKRDKPAVK
jgi:YidC/Oxa1 family membrane protein insertase